MQITAKFQFIEQFPTVILRNIVTKNLDLDSGKRKKDEILHFVQNDGRRIGGSPPVGSKTSLLHQAASRVPAVAHR